MKIPSVLILKKACGALNAIRAKLDGPFVRIGHSGDQALLHNALSGFKIRRFDDDLAIQ
jgi:hypothetical protein